MESCHLMHALSPTIAHRERASVYDAIVVLVGFVRFVSPKSVQRALELFKISEIEVQDVSVMIKPLKTDAPAE